MKHPALALATALCLASPSFAAAQALDCPQPGPVFSEADSTPLDLPGLAQTVGSADLDGHSLGTIAGRIRANYPNATDADVADIMITAFCTYLNTDAPADHRSEAYVTTFEKQAYDATFGGPAPVSYSRQGWLYGN